MRKIFKDEAQQEQFLRDGFFIKPLLTEAEVRACLDVYAETDKDSEVGKYNTLEVNNYENRKAVFEGLNKIIGEKIRQHLIDHKYIGYNFAVKRAGDNDKFHSHRDDIHVDESQFVNVNVWIPLCNVNEENGALYIVPNSHMLPCSIRGIGLPFEYSAFENDIQENRLSINIPIGNALFFDARIIHGSPKNLSKKDRVAIITSLIPEEAEPIVYMHYEGLDHGKAELFHAPHEFYLNIKINHRPENFESKGVVDYNPVQMEQSEFLSIIKAETKKATA